MNKIYIVVGNPGGKKEYFFIEIVISLYSYLKDNNYNVELILKGNQVDSNNKNLHIGIFNCVHKMPQNYIMFNIEPAINRCVKYNNKLCNAKAILNIIEEYEVQNSKNILFPITYHPVIENIFNIDRNSIIQNIDVLFYGFMNNRRIEIVNDIKNASINIYCPNKPITNDYNGAVFGPAKDTLIERSKIILITNYYKNDIDLPRALYCLSKKKLIIADSYGDNYLLKDKFENVFPVVETNNLINTIKYYLSNDKERNDKAEAGYNYVKQKYNIENYIDEIINIINE